MYEKHLPGNEHRYHVPLQGEAYGKSKNSAYLLAFEDELEALNWFTKAVRICFACACVDSRGTSLILDKYTQLKILHNLTLVGVLGGT